MKITSGFQATLKYIVGWSFVFGIRLLPFRPPNIEPVLTTTMPFSKKYGWFGTLIFAFFSIVLFDLATQKIGSWTLITAVAYGMIGLGAYFYFKDKDNSRKYYFIYSIIGTLAYDALTGLTIGPLMFGQSFSEAFIGQIPFTAYHLAGNIALSLTLSPYLYKWVVNNKELELASVAQRLAPAKF